MSIPDTGKETDKSICQSNPRGRRNFQIRIREEDARSIRARCTRTRGNWIEIGQTWRRKSCTPPVRTLSTLDGWTGIQVKRVYIYIHISTVSSRKLKLLYQTAARLAADFSCNTCLSRDSRVSSRGFPAKLSSLVTRETRVSAENRSKSRWKWLEERMESSIQMKIFDCPDCGWGIKRASSRGWWNFILCTRRVYRSANQRTKSHVRLINCDLSQ